MEEHTRQRVWQIPGESMIDRRIIQVRYMKSLSKKELVGKLLHLMILLERKGITIEDIDNMEQTAKEVDEVMKHEY